jgi:BASS family bile acid:Na+ symporter
VVGLTACSYSIGWLTAKWMKWDRSIIVTLTFNSGIRNISAGAVIATAYFPPAAATPLILTMLFLQMMAACFAQLLRARYGMGDAPPKVQPTSAKALDG